MKVGVFGFVGAVFTVGILAFGFATQQDWATYAWIAVGPAAAVVAIVRAVVSNLRKRAPMVPGVTTVGDPYNDLYTGKTPQQVVYGNGTGPVAEQTFAPPSSTLDTGKIMVYLSK